MLAHVGVGVRPGVAVLKDLVGARRADLGHHEGGYGGGEHDGAAEVQRARGVDCGEPGVAAGGAEDVWGGGEVWREGFEAAEDVVSYASVGWVSMWMWW